MIYGITGIFGSGKSTVAKLLKAKGYKHINLDKLGHEILQKLKSKVVKEFGKEILTKNKIDRTKLKDIVFYDSKKLKKLNSLLHPAIIKETKNIIKKSKNKRIVIDGALLIEAKALNIIDKLIVVKTTKQQQLKRALKKSKYTKKEISNILSSQLSQKEKLKYADIVIDNSKSLAYTKKQLSKIK